MRRCCGMRSLFCASLFALVSREIILIWSHDGFHKSLSYCSCNDVYIYVCYGCNEVSQVRHAITTSSIKCILWHCPCLVSQCIDAQEVPVIYLTIYMSYIHAVLVDLEIAGCDNVSGVWSFWIFQTYCSNFAQNFWPLTLWIVSV